ncbi:MAG TPA: ABC-F family ATP-binding cassette domain-containing protein [Firmicutes bacterium]|nr:ABC-F family ATP-binding cassette domain-containing protein [Bacillota bacterium]
MIITDLAKYYGDNLIFNEVTANVGPSDKIGLVGANGVGKTTLLKVLAGEEDASRGQINHGKNYTVGRLTQTLEAQGKTLQNYLAEPFRGQIKLAARLRSLEHKLAALQPGAALEKTMDEYARAQLHFEHGGGWDYLVAISSVASGLGFSEEDLNRSVDSFSGGERMRVNLARLLLSRPSLLLLDEPTNHLDVAGIQWLEGFLNSRKQAFIIVSHDRYFLDKTVTRIWELHNQRLYQYRGNYSQYLPLRIQRQAQLEESQQRQEQEKERLEAFVRKFRAGTRARQAKSAAKRLERMEDVELFEADPTLAFRFEAKRQSGRDVAFLKDIRKSYNSNSVLKGITAEIKRGDRIALMGPNGSGKSTLLKILAGELTYQGNLRWGTGVEPAYFSQNISLNPKNDVLGELYEEHRLELGVLRSVLARFLFTAEDVFKRTTMLSGGEKSRLALAKLLLHRPNFLLLDEPTNHLDIFGREALENALADFDGTILFVSHDRYFIDKIAHKIWFLDEGRITEFIGNFSHFEKTKSEEKAAPETPKPGPKRRAGETAKKTGPSLRQLERERERLEEEINSLEEQKANLERKLASPRLYESEAKSVSIIQEYRRVEAKLLVQYELWENIVDRLQER